MKTRLLAALLVVGLAPPVAAQSNPPEPFTPSPSAKLEAGSVEAPAASAVPAAAATAAAATAASTTAVAAGAVAPASPSSAPPALRLVGTATAFTPLLDFALPRDFRLEVPVSAAGTLEDTSAFTLDRDGTRSGAGAVVSPRARVGLRLTGSKAWTHLKLLAEYEHDLPTGSLAGALPAGPGMPGSDALTQSLRKASLRVNYAEWVVLGGGVMTSNWGLGLMANDGAHGWEPGNARFADPRGGDRVLRVFAATGPHTAHGLVAALAVDRVLDDDSLLLGAEQAATPTAGDDSASQVVGSVSAGKPGETWAGVYVAHRTQASADGRTLVVTALDGSATLLRTLDGVGTLTAGVEVAYLMGQTSLSGTGSFPTQAVQQLGVLTRNTLDLGRFGFALDGAFASGDRNGDDGSQNAFRGDPNADLGLLLFRQVLAAQSARAVAVAGNPQLVGLAAPGLERLPTRGGLTNTVAVFPRAFVRPMDGVELYGGVLLAWAAMPLADPFNTRLAGGSLRNVYDGRPGGLLGTEVDVGARGRFLLGGTELTVGLEGGVLLPGDAFRAANGTVLGTVMGGRLMLGYRL